MNAKDKAKELFDKYQVAGSQWYVDITKKYAIIAVDEILKITCLKDLDYEKYFNDNNEFKRYWQDVKKEIELLK